eukprot:11042944-Karenia_brevis.AAC.1
MLCFFAGKDHLIIPRAKEFQSENDRKAERGKTLSYEKENQEIRESLDTGQMDGWLKWKRFVTGRPSLNGHVPIPTGWVDTERKSRLCDRGDLDDTGSSREGSPTAEIEGHRIPFNYAASNILVLRTADNFTSYFQSDVLDR